MKRSKIYLFLLSGLLLAACSKEDEPVPTPGGEDAFATVSVAVDGINGTKATKADATQPGTDAENKIKNLTVVFIDESKNEVIAHGYREIGEDEQNTTARVGLKTGTYKMLLLANTNNISSFKPSDYYDEMIASLEKQGSENGFVMSNIPENIEIKAGENEIKAKDGTPVKIKRLVGRIDLSKLTVDFKYNDGESGDSKDKDLQGITGLKFRLKRIFLANVRPESYLFEAEGHLIEKGGGSYLRGIEDDSYYNNDNSEIAKESTYAPYLSENKEPNNVIEIKEDGSLDNVASFYAMTNSATKEVGSYPVILYIKGDLYDSGNKKPVLSNRYFRIKLAKGVQRNTLYKIEATIQGKGSPEPGDNKENIDLSVTITVKSWEGKTLDVITINDEIKI